VNETSFQELNPRLIFNLRPEFSEVCSNVKIFVTLSYGKGCIGSEEFVAEDLSEEDIVGLVLIYMNRG
jgi:hypothetical protein